MTENIFRAYHWDSDFQTYYKGGGRGAPWGASTVRKVLLDGQWGNIHYYRSWKQIR